MAQNLNDLYDIGSRGNLRGKSLEGFIRPTIKQFFTSANFEELSNVIPLPQGGIPVIAAGASVDWANPTYHSNILPASIAGRAAVTTSEYLYLIGISNNEIWRSPLDDIFNFTNLGAVLPISSRWGSVIVLNNTIYIYGGADQDGDKDDIAYASLDDITNWTLIVDGMPSTHWEYHSCTSDADYVYVLGGNGNDADRKFARAPIDDPTNLTEFSLSYDLTHSGFTVNIDGTFYSINGTSSFKSDSMSTITNPENTYVNGLGNSWRQGIVIGNDIYTLSSRETDNSIKKFTTTNLTTPTSVGSLPNVPYNAYGVTVLNGNKLYLLGGYSGVYHTHAWSWDVTGNTKILP